MGNRLDYDIIVSLVPVGAKVLDLGCGDGELLARLVSERQAQARGVEINEAKVRACIARGLSVRQGNIEEGLADFRSGAFDYVILSDTIAYLNTPTPLVREMLRVGRHAIVSFENASYIGARLRFLRGEGFGPTLASGEPRARAITPAHFREFVGVLPSAKVEQVLFVRTDESLPPMPIGLEIEVTSEALARIMVYVMGISGVLLP